MYAIYARQSVDKLDSVSIESQIDFCKYETKGSEYILYVDKGYSGKNTQRPEFTRMIKDIKEGKINQVVVYKLDRISRSILDFSKMMEMFGKYKVEFISSTEKFDTSTPMGRAMLNICIVFAQLERETIQKRVSDAYVSRSRMGLYMGGRVPYGFTREKCLIGGVNSSKYIPVNSEISQLEFIFNHYSQPSVSAHEVVRELKRQGMHKTNSEWASSKLTSLLKNPIYVRADIDIYNFYKTRGACIINDIEDFIGTNGCYLYSKNAQESNYRKDMMNYENMILVIAPHEGIVDSDTWIKCRLKCEKNKQIPNGKQGHKSWLTGRVKCGICGYALRMDTCKNKTTTRTYFRCSGCGQGECKGFGTIRQELVEQIVFDEIKVKLDNFELKPKEKNENNLKIGRINAEIVDKKAEIENLLSKVGFANETLMKYINTNIERLDNEICHCEQEISMLENNNTQQSSLLKEVMSASGYIKKWNSIDIRIKQRIAKTLIDKIMVTKENVDIVWTI